MRPGLRECALALCGLALWTAAATASAQGRVVIYRCTDASGAVTLQNGTPCPKGSKQERRVVDTATSSAPAYAPPPAPLISAPQAPAATPPAAPSPAPAPIESAPAIADAERLPPPWLYECRTYDNDRYFSENGNPPPRCVTLSTTGLGGVIGESNGSSACEMKTDQCQRVPDGAVCQAWRVRLREAESALRFGVTADRERDEAELQRLTRITRDSTCGLP
jgi:hypothetical protein